MWYKHIGYTSNAILNIPSRKYTVNEFSAHLFNFQEERELRVPQFVFHFDEIAKSYTKSILCAAVVRMANKSLHDKISSIIIQIEHKNATFCQIKSNLKAVSTNMISKSKHAIYPTSMLTTIVKYAGQGKCTIA